jgi:hypothetical protein
MPNKVILLLVLFPILSLAEEYTGIAIIDCGRPEEADIITLSR